MLETVATMNGASMNGGVQSQSFSEAEGTGAFDASLDAANTNLSDAEGAGAFDASLDAANTNLSDAEGAGAFDASLDAANTNLSMEEQALLQEDMRIAAINEKLPFLISDEEVAVEESAQEPELMAEAPLPAEETAPPVLPYLYPPQVAQDLSNLPNTDDSGEQSLFSGDAEADPELKMLNSLKQLMGRSNVRVQENALPQDPRFSLDEQTANSAQSQTSIEGELAAIQASSAQTDSANIAESKSLLTNHSMQSVLSAAQPLAPPDVRTQNERIQSVLNQSIRGKQASTPEVSAASDRIDVSQILNPEQVQGSAALPGNFAESLANNDGLDASEIKKVTLDTSANLMQYTANNEGPNSGISVQAAATQQVDSTAFVDSMKSAQATQASSLVDAPFDMEQISKHMKLSKSGTDDNEVTLQLTPENLGKLVMKIQQKGHELSVDMRVENNQAKQLIEANFGELKHRFLDKDFSFDNMTLNVNIDQRSASQFEDSPDQSRFQGDYVGDKQSERIAGLESESTKLRPNLSSSGLHMYV